MKTKKLKNPAYTCTVHMFSSSLAAVLFKALSMQAAPGAWFYYVTSSLFMAASVYAIVSGMVYSSMQGSKKFILSEKAKLNRLKSARATFIFLLIIIFFGILISAATKESLTLSHDHLIIVFFLAVAVEEGSFLLLEKGVFTDRDEKTAP